MTLGRENTFAGLDAPNTPPNDRPPDVFRPPDRQRRIRQSCPPKRNGSSLPPDTEGTGFELANARAGSRAYGQPSADLQVRRSGLAQAAQPTDHRSGSREN